MSAPASAVTFWTLSATIVKLAPSQVHPAEEHAAARDCGEAGSRVTSKTSAWVPGSLCLQRLARTYSGRLTHGQDFQARRGLKQRSAVQKESRRRTDAWRRSVGSPLLRDDPALRPQAFTYNAGPRLFKQGGRGAPKVSCAGTPPHGRPRTPSAGKQEAQAPTQGDVHAPGAAWLPGP